MRSPRRSVDECDQRWHQNFTACGLCKLRRVWREYVCVCVCVAWTGMSVAGLRVRSLFIDGLTTSKLRAFVKFCARFNFIVAK